MNEATIQMLKDRLQVWKQDLIAVEGMDYKEGYKRVIVLKHRLIILLTDTENYYVQNAPEKLPVIQIIGKELLKAVDEQIKEIEVSMEVIEDG